MERDTIFYGATTNNTRRAGLLSRYNNNCKVIKSLETDIAKGHYNIGVLEEILNEIKVLEERYKHLHSTKYKVSAKQRKLNKLVMDGILDELLKLDRKFRLNAKYMK